MLQSTRSKITLGSRPWGWWPPGAVLLSNTGAAVLVAFHLRFMALRGRVCADSLLCVARSGIVVVEFSLVEMIPVIILFPKGGHDTGREICLPWVKQLR